MNKNNIKNENIFIDKIFSKENKKTNLKKIICILHGTRTGSTYLSDLLNQTKNFGIIGEYFSSRWIDRFIERNIQSNYLEYLLDTKVSDITGVFTFRCSPSDIEKIELDNKYKKFNSYFKKLISKTDYFIILKRKNVIKQSLSLTLSKKASYWTRHKLKNENIKINELNLHEFLFSLSQIEKENFILESFENNKDIDSVTIYYEDLNAKKLINKLNRKFNFINKIKIKSKIKKTNIKHNRKEIFNNLNAKFKRYINNIKN